MIGWGRAGGAERAVWAQSVLEEAHRQRGRNTAAVLLDLTKAYERVPLELVWRRGRAKGFPARLLALGLEACAFTRRLIYRKAVSQEANTLTALLAGLGMASDMLFLVLSEALEETLGLHSHVHVCLVADDIKLTVDDNEVHRAAMKIDRITGQLCEKLEGEMGMRISRNEGNKKGKTVATASSRDMRKAIAERMKKRGFGLQGKVKNLGVDFAAGGKRKTFPGGAQKTRMKAAGAKLNRALRMGKKLAPTSAKTAITASITYGVTVNGVTEEELGRMRRMAARAYGPIQGRSITARLWMEEADPGHVIIRKQVGQWVQAVWDDLLPSDVLHDAWRLAYKTVALSTKPHAAAAGGAGVYWSALRRLGWTAPSIDTVRIRDGTILYFGKGDPPEGTEGVDPKAIMKYLKEDLEDEVLLRSGLARELADVAGRQGYARCKEMGVEQGVRRNGGCAAFGEEEQEARQAESWRRARFVSNEVGPMPWLELARQVLRWARKRGRHKAAAAMRAMVEGAWATPRQLWARGKREEDTCECGKQAGTLYHWLARCGKGKEMRDEKCPPEVLRQGVTGLWDTLYSRGVAAKPKPVDKVRERTWWADDENSRQKMASGVVYVDGSFKGMQWRAARAAWSAVHIDQDGVWRWTYSGTLAERHVSSYRAELTAVLQVLRIAIGPIHLFCDNQEVVKGVGRGRRHCTAASADCADVWRKIWRIIDEIGEDFKIDWLPGHSSWIHVLEGKITPHQHVGNALADKAAKESRAWAEGLAPNRGFAGHAKKARAWYRWVLDFATTWPYELWEKSKEEEDVGERAREPGEKQKATNIRHEVWRIEGRMKCRRCARDFGRGDLQAANAYESCKGTAAGRALAALTGNINYVWADYALPYIDLVKKGAALVKAAKVPELVVDWNQLEVFSGTVEGRHALQGCLAEGAWQERGRRGREPTLGAREEGAPSEGLGVIGHGGGDRGESKRQGEEKLPERFVRRRVTGKQPERRLNPERREEEEEEGGSVGRLASKEHGAKRIRLRGKQKPPGIQKEARLVLKDKEKAWSRGHAIRRIGGIVFCARCGNYARKRFGAGLKAKCTPPPSLGVNAAGARLQRLHRGKHPLQKKRKKTTVKGR